MGRAAAGSCISGALIKFVSGVFGFSAPALPPAEPWGRPQNPAGAAALSQVRRNGSPTPSRRPEIIKFVSGIFLFSPSG
jgi:hypothetical protein